VKTVFISYSRSDSQEANKITAILKKLKIDYFEDVKDIQWGKDVQKEVKIALADCQAVLVIVSPGSVKSQWVPYEIGYATALKKRILPYVTHESIEIPRYLTHLNFAKTLEAVKNAFTSTWAQNEMISRAEKLDEKLEAKYLEWWEEQNHARTDGDVRFEGLNFWLDRRVFSPSLRLTYSSFFASTFLNDLEGKSVLDIGTGCGALAILAAKRKAQKVIAIDIDPVAVRNAKRNVTTFHLGKKIKVYNGDLFDTPDSLFDMLEGKFDVIVSNLPIAIKANAWSHLDTDLKLLLEKWVNFLPKYLSKTGVAYLSWASFGDQQLIKNILSNSGFKIKEFEENTFGVRWQLFEVRQSER